MPESLKRKLDDNAVPDGELNPLVNPLLAANMGRWAEVYFTTPPQGREQAIQDLLRELANNSPTRSSSASVIDIDKRKRTEPTTGRQEASAVVICGGCRHGNPAGQRFCGMCGVALPVSSEGSAARVSGSWPAGQAKISQTQPETQTKIDQTKIDQTKIDQTKIDQTKIDQTKNDQATNPAKVSRATIAPATISPAAINQKGSNGAGAVGRGSTSERDDGLLLRQRLLDNDLPSFAVETESFPYRYRLSIGVAVAILLGILVYIAWHGTNAVSGSAQHTGLPQAVPADQSAQANPSPANRNPQPVLASAAKPVPAESSTAPTAPPARLSENPHSPAESAAGRQRSTPSVASSGGAAGQNGAEELATAEKYLNGSAGTARDGEAAAQWLWKAVAKGNLTATLALSDLYLHGEGVPKSCDQGRLLLDAAAKKGVAAAAYRLRNLQAFGCD